MKRFTICTLLLAASLVALCSLAVADDHAGMSNTAMMTPKPSDETKALGKFFATNATWTGSIPAGAMGPDSKAATSHGHVMAHPIVKGFWYACDVEDRVGMGKDAMTWHGMMMVGWDMNSKSYKATCADNMGTITQFDGSMNGDAFVLETPNDVMMMGQMMKDRLTFTPNTDGTMGFKDEHKVGESDWMTFETATMLKSGKASMTAAKTTAKPKSDAAAAAH